MSKVILRIAAKAVITDDRGNVLLIREAKYKDGTNLGKYQMPGGRLELGEGFYEALHREVKEETGLDIKPMKPLYVGEWSPTINGVTQQIVAIFMLCEVESIDVKLSDEHDDFKWVDPSNYTIQMTEPEPKVLEAFIKYGK